MTWTGAHVRLSWAVEHVDAFIADVLAPAMTGEWFFVRYGEGGPHLRVRARDADLPEKLRALVAGVEHPTPADDPKPAATPTPTAAPTPADDPEWQHGEVREVRYEPEVARYGGPELLPIAEEVFCRSTEVAVAVLRATRTRGARFTAAVELVMATASAVGLDRAGAASWLRSLASGWRRADEPVAPPGVASHAVARSLHTARGPQLAARWEELDANATGAIAYWADHVREAGLPAHVWASQLHMLLNRLGVPPEEERVVCRLVALTAESPAPPEPIHGGAADRGYLVASRYHAGEPDQGPRPEPRTPFTPLPWQRQVRLPDPAPPSTSLVEALADRRTVRGAELAGGLDAARLATLLWTAHGALPDGRRPHPSAGGRHSARLRLLAWRVDGVEPGLYDVDEVRRVLVRVAGPPPESDVLAASMWFGEGEDRVDPAGVPAVLGLYARVGALRRAYGTRALRLALVETGHLAQNLALVAAACGVRLGLFGGFHDDVAHDVLCLDGVDDVLSYLVPLAGA
ncbi:MULTISPECIES: thiopeptide-type bacteriocin biosynthesis protein [Actinosynnema]|uniref:thiopeptide-type bacteriocin biosynthesis protein n=1 Tax=Actinosynnema TaxID=40566 RepID=UPI0020A3723B|nr:thiopeptide-type bacteriocin biosynthesis protein [Actinosynnema pretiosum]MCP2098127.1 thiopeptide-type bacteriocin biosynthesis domain-containing protein [Actinosynnema pretiosum]